MLVPYSLSSISIPEGERIVSLEPEFRGYAICSDGRIWSFRLNKWKKLTVNKHRGKGYIYTPLRRIRNGKYVTCTVSVHRLVAKAFVPCIGNYNDYDVNHKDGDPTNNHWTNLEWLSHQSNLRHAANTGLSRALTDSKVHDLCYMIQQNPQLTMRELSDLTGVGRMTLNYIRNGNTFTRISKNYDFSKCNRKQKQDDAVIHQICKAIARGLKTTEIAKVFGVNSEYISNIKSGKIRKDIGEQYNIFTLHRGVGAPREVIEKMCVFVLSGFTDSEIVKIFDNKYSLTLVNSLRRGKTHIGISKHYFTELSLSRIEKNKSNIELKAQIEGVYRMGADASGMLSTMTSLITQEESA